MARKGKLDPCSNMLVEEHGMDADAAQQLINDLKKGGSPEKILDAAERRATILDFEAQQAQNAPQLMQHAFETSYNFVSQATDKASALSRMKILLTGSTKEGQGFLNSVSAAQETRTSLMHGRIITSFLNETGLSRTQMHKLMRNKKFQEDVVRERFPFTNKTKTGNKEAHAFAKIIELENQRVVKEANASGAAIIYNNQFVTSQYHNPTNIKQAGFNDWLNTIMPLLDKDKTFDGFGAPEGDVGILRKIYQNIIEPGSGGDGLAMNEALSASRRLHFKDADSWLQYNKRFGHEDPVQAMIEGLELQSDRTVLIQRLGPDPSETLDNLKKQIKQDYGLTDKDFDIEGVNTRIDLVTGNFFIPGNPSIVKYMSVLQNWTIITSMGKAMLSSFSDPLLQAMTMHYQGKSFFSAYFDTFRNLKRSFTRELGIDEKDAFKLLGIGIDGVLTSSSSRYVASDKTSGTLSRLADKMFMYNGLNYWTNANREGFARMASAFMGDQASTPWNKLTENYRRILSQYDITEKDWSLINKIGAKDITDEVKRLGLEFDIYANERYVTPDHIRKSSRSKQAQAVANKLEIFFVNESRIAVPQPGKNEKAIMSFGFKRGTVPGALAEAFWLLRSFPLTMAIQQYPRMMQNGIGNTMMHLTPAIMLGYASITAKDLIRGKEPRDPFDTSTAAASLIQSGVAGIAGDLIYNSFSDHGYSWPEFIGGPVFGYGADAVKIFKGITNGEADAARAWKSVKDNLPFANLFYLEPAVNYGFLYQIQEYVNPGYLGRMENAIKNLEGQDYMEVFRPSAVVGGY